jgi:hypothetical protein
VINGRLVKAMVLMCMRIMSQWSKAIGGCNEYRIFEVFRISMREEETVDGVNEMVVCKLLFGSEREPKADVMASKRSLRSSLV